MIYEGRVYIRPVNRGVVLEEAGIDGLHFDEWLAMALPPEKARSVNGGGQWTGKMRIVVEILEGQA